MPIFVTVDPKRDTVDVIKNYISSFHPSMVGVTGSKKQVDQATGAFKVFYSLGEKMADGVIWLTTLVTFIDGPGWEISRPFFL